MTQTFKNNGMWGDAIHWINWEQRKIYGWKSPLPQPGDFFESKMDSGRIAVFKLETVNPCDDPDDMFFATVSDFGYKDEMETKEAP